MPSKFIKVEMILPPKDQWCSSKLNALNTNIERYLKREVSKVLLNAFGDTVENWDHAPKFVAEYSEPYGTRKEIYAHPKGQYTTQWQRVSGGVRGRFISPRKPGGLLKYQKDYTPATRPGGKWGGAGRKTGPWVHSKGKEWPGIEPREFSKEIVNQHGKALEQGVQDTVKRTFR